MSFVIHRGDALTVLRTLPDESVNCCVTSPPYWGLRDYGTAKWEGGDSNCAHSGVARRCDKAGRNDKQSTQKGSSSDRVSRTCLLCGANRIDAQIGLEETPEAYVEHIVEVFREVRRVLRSDGTCWVNLGDSYCGQPSGSKSVASKLSKSGLHFSRETLNDTHTKARLEQAHAVSSNGKWHPPSGLKPKDLIGIPWRVAFALQADGWWLRSDIIWHKPNPMPESVTDRPTKAHEYLFLLTKSQKYWYDADAVREPFADARMGASGVKLGTPEDYATAAGRGGDQGLSRFVGDARGRNKRSVWTLATLPTPEAHFATYPIELPETCILAGCPVDGVVLDPFAGMATTGLAAIKNGRSFVGIELKAEYIHLAEDRARKYYPLLVEVNG